MNQSTQLTVESIVELAKAQGTVSGKFLHEHFPDHTPAALADRLWCLALEDGIFYPVPTGSKWLPIAEKDEFRLSNSS